MMIHYYYHHDIIIVIILVNLTLSVYHNHSNNDNIIIIIATHKTIFQVRRSIQGEVNRPVIKEPVNSPAPDKQVEEDENEEGKV